MLMKFLLIGFLIIGRKVAIDASMCIYQFLIAVRQDGNVLTNAEGETTRYMLLLIIQWYISKVVIMRQYSAPICKLCFMFVDICKCIVQDEGHFVNVHYFTLLLFSHLMGLFYRTIRMVENGIKPVYVFDGKPPDMKSGEVCNVHISKLSVPFEAEN